LLGNLLSSLYDKRQKLLSPQSDEFIFTLIKHLGFYLAL